MKKVVTVKELIKRGFPRNLAMALSFVLLVGAGAIVNGGGYKQNKVIFPENGIVETVEDGDTFSLETGQSVRMLGVNAPERGKENYDKSKFFLDKMIKNKKVWLEYDRYQDDKFGRILAWVWIDCETEKPKFEDSSYMHLSGKESKPFIEVKPVGCQNGELLNKKLVLENMAVGVTYENRGRLKYKMEIR